MSPEAGARGLVYPLVGLLPMTKKNVNHWWEQQPFRLRLKGYQGNCKWCWKKSDRKLYTIARESPEAFRFPDRMEALYGKTGPEFLRTPPLPDDYARRFFRGNRSAADIVWEAQNAGGGFVPSGDDHAVFDEKYDLGAGCEESCEVYGEDDADEEPE